LYRPTDSQSRHNATNHGDACKHRTTIAAMTMPHQIEGSVPVRRGRPRQPNFRHLVAKIVGLVGQTIGIDTEERVQGLDLDVESLHQGDRHRPQFGKAPANRYLREGAVSLADRRQLLRELVNQPCRQIVASGFAGSGRHRGRAAPVFITPRQLACTKQGTISNECEACHGPIHRNVGFDPPGNRKRLARAREAQERFCRRDDRSNFRACRDDRRQRRRDLLASREDKHHGLAVGVLDGGRGGGEISERALRVQTIRPGRGQCLGAHPLIRTIPDKHLTMLGASAPDNDRDGAALHRGEVTIGFGPRRRQDRVGADTGGRRTAGFDRATVQLDDPARVRRELNTDVSGHFPPFSRYARTRRSLAPACLFQ
jgi:hypothetical protein